MRKLWVDKYSPKTLDDYVWQNSELRLKVDEWINDKALPHLLFAGSPGTGKTSLAFLLLGLLEIPKGDVLYINASKERRVEDIQSRISNFVSTWALGETGIKYVLLDEADAISPLAQKMLRGDMVDYSDVCRFILTANYPQKIIEALHSRCQTFNFTSLDKEEFIVRVGQILANENIEYDIDVLCAYVDIAYPDLRRAINLVEKRTTGNKLMPPEEQDSYSKDYLFEMTGLFNEGKYTEARKLIVSQAQPEEYPDIFKWLYKNTEIFGKTEEQQDDALMVVAKGVYRHAIVSDPEINLAATLVELARIARQ